MKNNNKKNNNKKNNKLLQSIGGNLLICVLSLVFGLSSISQAQNAKKPTIMVVPSDNWCVQNGFVQTFNN